MFIPFLTFSFSNAVSDALTVISSVFDFITGNLLLVGIIFTGIVLSIIFAIVNKVR